MPEHRFPRADDEFNTYIQNAVPYLLVPANSARLQISAPNLAALPLAKTAWDNWFPKSQDPNQRTTTITENKNDARDVLEELLTDIYEDIPESVLITADRNTLNLPERKAASARPAIEDSPYPDLLTEPGALIIIRNRTHKDSTRTSRHPDADGVEVVYLIDKERIPASPEECNKNLVSKKSRVKVQLSVADAGKFFSCYTRWVNLSDASKNSPWSLVMTVVVPK
jgi:hypothetical protein